MWAPRHEDVWESGGIAPCILNLGTRWRWVTGLDVNWGRGPLFWRHVRCHKERSLVPVIWLNCSNTYTAYLNQVGSSRGQGHRDLQTKEVKKGRRHDLQHQHDISQLIFQLLSSVISWAGLQVWNLELGSRFKTSRVRGFGTCSVHSSSAHGPVQKLSAPTAGCKWTPKFQLLTS